MKPYEICITDLAERDILEISRYIVHELHAASAALKLLDEIDAAIFKCRVTPQIYGLVLDERLRNLGYRKINIKNYLIFFRIDEEHHVINIERVLYGKRDWLRIL